MIKIKLFATFLFYLLFTSFNLNAQKTENQQFDTKDLISRHYTEVYLGTQMSGMRKEDFQAGKYSPYLQISFGKWITPAISVSVKYQGPYFRYISDNFKHKYIFVSGDFTIDPVKLLSRIKKDNRFSLYVIRGIGLFYNNLLKKTQLAFNGGIQTSYSLNENLILSLKVGGIAGWKIYQHDKDILLNSSIGLIRKL